MKNLAVSMAWTFSVAFLGATLLGFLPNPLLGENAFFITNVAHNLVHLATAIGFIVAALLGERASIRFMQVFGIIYLLVGVYGFMMLGAQEEGHLLHLIHINRLDNFLHIVLGLVIAAAGWIARANTDRKITVSTI